VLLAIAEFLVTTV